jgi:hypothetical protein
MYEVEYKTEISEAERDKLIFLFELNHFGNFLKKPSVLQNDYYIEAQESPYGGFDLKRYRDEGDKYFYTEKIWEDVNGSKARKETEKEISKEELKAGIENSPVIIKLQKTRDRFVGEYRGKEIHIDMDSVKFDHCPSMRYFVEAETMTEIKENIKELKELMKNFLKESLGKDEITEAKGMFTMAFKKDIIQI